MAESSFLTELGQGVGQSIISQMAITSGSQLSMALDQVSGMNLAGGTGGTTVNLKDNVTELNAQLGALLNTSVNLGKDIASLAQNDWELTGKQLEAAGSSFAKAGSSVGKKYIESKWNRIQNLWENKVSVTIGSLIAEAAPFAKDPKNAAKAMLNKVQQLTLYILDINAEISEDATWGEFGLQLAKGAGDDLGKFAASDAAMQESLGQLSAVSGLGTTLRVALQILDVVQILLKIIDIAKPILRVVKDLALSFWSGGTSATSAAQESAGIIQRLCQECGITALQTVKKYVFAIKINLPQIIVESVKVLSVKEAIKTMAGNNSFNNFLYGLLTDTSMADNALNQWQSWMAEVSTEGNPNNIWLYAQTYMAVAQNALVQTGNKYSSGNKTIYWNNLLKQQPSFEALNDFFNSATAGHEYLRIFTNTFTQAYLQDAITRAKVAAKTINYSYGDNDLYLTYDEGPIDDNFSISDAVSIFDQILDDMTTSNISWTEDTIRIASKQIYEKI